MVNLAAIAVLVLVNVLTFHKHYVGRATFPWDFLGGYHAQAFGWFDNGGVLAPPSWFPWTNMGFPGFLTLQSGSWYLPLAALHALGIVYTVHVATIFQVLHVLFGAIGAYFFVLALCGRRHVALLLGVAYHFSVTFYANQEHVDIVRAAAWAPWLLYSLVPAIAKTRMGWAVAAFTTSQLLVAGYPGNIISLVYGCCAAFVVQFLHLQPGKARAMYVGSVASSVFAGVMMALLKWLPLALNGSKGLGLEHFPSQPFAPIHLLTFFAPYSDLQVPGDITMRSLWLPTLALWGCAFASVRSVATRSGVAMIFVAFFAGMVASGHPSIRTAIPGLSISRFPISDWRPVLHLGILSIAADGWTRLLAGELTVRRVLTGLLVSLAVFTCASTLAADLGLSIAQIKRMQYSFAVGALLCGSCALIPIAYRSRGAGIALALIATLVCYQDGRQFHRAQSAPWAPSWNQDSERAWLGGRLLNTLLEHRGPLGVIEHRPDRFVVGSSPADVIANRNSPYYNRCWYIRAYCLFGYDNVRLSLPHLTLLKAFTEPGADDLLEFVRRSGQLLLLDPSASSSVPPLSVDSRGSSAVGRTAAAHVQYVAYSPSNVIYRLYVPGNTLVVENEIFWPGWTYEVCNQSSHCAPARDVMSTAQGLRSWSIPGGYSEVRLHFVGPAVWPGYLAAALGLFLALVVIFLPRRALPARVASYLPA